MSPVKSPSSSRYKGKTVSSDSPAVPEEVERSDSERSTEEETERDPDSECAPLIDLWYEINPHFPKVPGGYVPPLPGRVLITLVRRDPDVSWAPLASSVPDLSIRKVFRFLYPFILNLGPTHPWVGRNGLTASFPTQVLWVCCSGPAF